MPSYLSPSYGEVHVVDTSAILDGARLQVFAVNRSADVEAPLEVALVDRSIAALESAELLTGPGPKAANSFDDPKVVLSLPFDSVDVREGRAHTTLPRLSVLAMTLQLAS